MQVGHYHNQLFAKYCKQCHLLAQGWCVFISLITAEDKVQNYYIVRNSFQ